MLSSTDILISNTVTLKTKGNNHPHYSYVIPQKGHALHNASKNKSNSFKSQKHVPNSGSLQQTHCLVIVASATYTVPPVSDTFEHGADFTAFQLIGSLCRGAQIRWRNWNSLGTFNHQSEKCCKNCDETNQSARQRTNRHFWSPYKSITSSQSRSLEEEELLSKTIRLEGNFHTHTTFLDFTSFFSISLFLKDCAPKNGLSEFPFYSYRWGLSSLNIFEGPSHRFTFARIRKQNDFPNLKMQSKNWKAQQPKRCTVEGKTPTLWSASYPSSSIWSARFSL